VPTCGGILDRVDGVLEDDRLRRVLEPLIGEPAPMRQAPTIAPGEDTAVTQQQRQQLLALLAQVGCGCLARTDEIADGLMHRIRHPHRGQLTGTEQPRKGDRVAPVGLDPIAWLAWDQGRRHDRAVVTQSLDLAVQPVPGRTGFIANVQLCIARRKLAEHLCHRRRRAVDLTEISDLPVAPAIGDRHRMLVLRRVKANKSFAILLHGPPSVHEARLGPPEQPSLLYCTKGRAAALNPAT